MVAGGEGDKGGFTIFHLSVLSASDFELWPVLL